MFFPIHYMKGHSVAQLLIHEDYQSLRAFHVCASVHHGFWKPFYLGFFPPKSPQYVGKHILLSWKEPQELPIFSFTVIIIKLTLLKTLPGVMQVQEPLLKKTAVASSMKHWGQGYQGYWKGECCSMFWEKRLGKTHPKRVHSCCIWPQLRLSKKQHEGDMEKFVMYVFKYADWYRMQSLWKMHMAPKHANWSFVPHLNKDILPWSF